MKKTMKGMISIIILISSVTSFAGAGGGNGGGVHYCPNNENKIQFFDLYEGKNARPRRPIPVFEQANGTEEQMINDAIKKLRAIDPFFARNVSEQIAFLNAPENSMRVNRKMKLIDDANYLWVDEGCTYEQLANWEDDENFLYIRTSLIQDLEKSPLDMAAFKMHEAIYKTVRLMHNLENSDKVRELNAYLFSNATVPKDLYWLFSYNTSGLSQDALAGNQLRILDNSQTALQLHLGVLTDEVLKSKLRLTITLPDLNAAVLRLKEIERQLSSHAISRSERKSLEAEKASLQFMRMRINFGNVPYHDYATQTISDVDQKAVFEVDLNNSKEAKKFLNSASLSVECLSFAGGCKTDERKINIKVEIIREGSVMEEDQATIHSQISDFPVGLGRNGQLISTVPLKFTVK